MLVTVEDPTAAVLLDADVGPFLAAVGTVVEAIAAAADAGRLDWRGQGQH